MRKSVEKEIFLTRYDFYEYVIISFELCNVSNTFQFFINIILRKYLNNFCSDYLDDILIYNETNEKHVEHIFKMLKKFQVVECF